MNVDASSLPQPRSQPVSLPLPIPPSASFNTMNVAAVFAAARRGMSFQALSQSSARAQPSRSQVPRNAMSFNALNISSSLSQRQRLEPQLSPPPLPSAAVLRDLPFQALSTVSAASELAPPVPPPPLPVPASVSAPASSLNFRDKTRVVTYRVPHNSACQIFDYQTKQSRYAHESRFHFFCQSNILRFFIISVFLPSLS